MTRACAAVIGLQAQKRGVIGAPSFQDDDAVRREHLGPVRHRRLVPAVGHAPPGSVLDPQRLDQAPHVRPVADRQVVARGDVRRSPARSSTRVERPTPLGAVTSGIEDSGGAGRGVKRGPATSPRPPKSRVLHQHRPRQQVEPRAQDPGGGPVSCGRTPAVGELRALRRASEVQVEAGRARVLEDDLSLPSPGAAGQAVPPAGVEAVSIRLHLHRDGCAGRLESPQLSARRLRRSAPPPREARSRSPAARPAVSSEACISGSPPARERRRRDGGRSRRPASAPRPGRRTGTALRCWLRAASAMRAASAG